MCSFLHVVYDTTENFLKFSVTLDNTAKMHYNKVSTKTWEEMKWSLTY